MDSLTHIVLGAACGELVAGKKLGNRAMLWGAVGNTIPDLDVFATFFTDDITSTSFHRGIMHSLLFIALAPWPLAKVTEWFYAKNHYRRPGYKATAMGIWLLFYILLAAGINFIPVLRGGNFVWYILILSVLLGAWFGRTLWKGYWKRNLSLVEVPYFTWANLFFWSILLHPLLDCFTNFGTQVFQPFSDYRVQWCTVSVADPFCSVPFGILMLLAISFPKNSMKRKVLTYAGLIWFSGYLCLYNQLHKIKADDAFEQALQEKGIDYQRYYTNPSILNNIVWYGVAETDTAYFFAMYGFNDRVRKFTKFSALPKNHALLNGIPQDDRAYRFLRWFSNGYYNVLPMGKDTFQVNDLRFGLLGDTLRDNNYVYPFMLFKNEKGVWDVIQNNRSKKGFKDSERSFGELWNRVKGQ